MTNIEDVAPVNLAEVESRALGRLTPMAHDYYASGTLAVPPASPSQATSWCGRGASRGLVMFARS